MGHAEYVARLGEDQLQSLIEHAVAQKTKLQKSGWVKLWAVSHSGMYVAWFDIDNYLGAVEWVRNFLATDEVLINKHGFELEVKAERYRPTDAPELLKLSAPKLGEQEGGGNG